MNSWEVLVLAVALAMDAFAVAVAAGSFLRNVTARQTFRLAWHFGLFQALMPVVGWGAGQTVKGAIEAVDHWVAFGLLALIGVRMILSRDGGEITPDSRDPTRGASLVVLSVATSVDALAVGLSLSVLRVSIWWPVLVIGIVAAAFTAAGLHLGRLAVSAPRIGRYSSILAGLLLLAIGLRILYEHGVF